MFKYYNANPLGLRVNDCTVRAYSLATGVSWDEAYRELSCFAQEECIMPDDVRYIDNFLISRFSRVYNHELEKPCSVKQFITEHKKGVYLITMHGHITCCIDGCVYDTFNPLDRILWDAYEVRQER